MPTTFEEAIEHFKTTDPRGEFVLVIEGKSFEQKQEEDQESWEQTSIPEHMEVYLNKGIDKKEAMKQVAKDRGISKRDVYQVLLEEKE